MTADRLIAAFHKARSARITFGWSPEADKALNELWEALAAYEGQQGAQAPAEAHGDKWEGAEEWMPLAWELCANECGEEACTELIWEGGPIPEPWGDRWLKYEDQAKEMIAMVRASLAAVQAPESALRAAAQRVLDDCIRISNSLDGSERHNGALAALRAVLAIPAPEGAQELCERICAAIQAADDKSMAEAGYMLDCNDCCRIVRDQFAASNVQPKGMQAGTVLVARGLLKEARDNAEASCAESGVSHGRLEYRKELVQRLEAAMVENFTEVAATPIGVEVVGVVRPGGEDGPNVEWLLEGGLHAVAEGGEAYLLVSHEPITNDDGYGEVVRVNHED